MVCTRFEKARILGARALQISMGAPVLEADAVGAVDPIALAWREFNAAVLPIQVQRASDVLD